MFQPIMKKISPFLLTVIAVLMCGIALLFAGCGAKNTPPAEPDTGGAVTPSTQPDNEKPSTEHTHEWGEWTTVKEATCTKTGLSSRTCTVCGEKDAEEQTIPTVSHSFAKGICKMCGFRVSEGLSTS